MKNTNDFNLEKVLNSISNMKEQQAPDFFYTRLKSRLESELNDHEMDLPHRSVYVIYAITFFLFISIILNKHSGGADINFTSNIESLASSYDQNISN